jgi:general secretion pathway protein C
MRFGLHPRRALEFGLLALVAYLGALGVVTALRGALDEPLPELDQPAPEASTMAPLEPLAAYATIAERDVFNGGGSATGPGDAPGPAPASLRLWGVAMHGGEARAVIEDLATHRQELYRVGDRLGDARLAAIDWDRVTLARAGGEATLALSTPESTRSDTEPASEPPAPAPAPGDRIRRTAENAFVVDRREITGEADNMSGLLTQLRAVAEVDDGRPAGFRLFSIASGSLFARLGLEDGDVVQRVNGTAITDPAALLGFLQRLRSEPRVALDIMRSGAPRTLVYDLR